MDKLKPCPFCGSSTVNDTSLPKDEDPHMYWVCPDCVACGPIGTSLEGATTAWNTRAEPTDAMIEAGMVAYEHCAATSGEQHVSVIYKAMINAMESE